MALMCRWRSRPESTADFPEADTELRAAKDNWLSGILMQLESLQWYRCQQCTEEMANGGRLKGASTANGIPRALYEGHFTVEGYAVAAGIVLDGLSRLGLLPQP